MILPSGIGACTSAAHVPDAYERALVRQVRDATIAECQLCLRDSAAITEQALPGESSKKVAWAYRVSADLLEGLRA